MSLSLLQDVHRPRGRFGWVRKQMLRGYARVIEWTTLLHRRTLNLARVDDFLYVGGEIRRADYAKLAALGITGVIDVRSERKDDAVMLKTHGIELLHLPVPDHFAPQRTQLEEGVSWALERIEKGGRIYSHCQHGVGRGPLMGLCILVAKGRPMQEAYSHLRQHRWQATLNDRQLAAVADFAEAWKNRRA